MRSVLRKRATDPEAAGLLARYVEVSTSAGLLAGSLCLLVFFAAAGWPGAPNYCLEQGACYCEAARPGPIAQPANTWSLLGFVVAGLAIAWHSARAHASGDALPDNPIARTRFYPGLYASAVLLLGPCSAFFHASLTDWGGAVDIFSMLLWICFLIFYNLTCSYGWTRGRFLTAYCVAVSVLMLPRLAFGPAGIQTFAGVFVAWVLTEVLVALPVHTLPSHRRARLHRDRRWLWASLATLALSFAIWNLGGTGGPFCDPESLLQGHAIWHGLNALGVALLYPYLRSQEASRSGAA